MNTLVCDGQLPWANNFLPPGSPLAVQLRRFWDAGGVDHISLTAAAGKEDTATAMGRIGLLQRESAPLADWVSIAHDAVSIRAAKTAGCLSVSFHFQSATPYDPRQFRTSDIEDVLIPVPRTVNSPRTYTTRKPCRDRLSRIVCDFLPQS